MNLRLFGDISIPINNFNIFIWINIIYIIQKKEETLIVYAENKLDIILINIMNLTLQFPNVAELDHQENIEQLIKLLNIVAGGHTAVS